MWRIGGCVCRPEAGFAALDRWSPERSLWVNHSSLVPPSAGMRPSSNDLVGWWSESGASGNLLPPPTRPESTSTVSLYFDNNLCVRYLKAFRWNDSSARL
jgi:hypothetical protein